MKVDTPLNKENKRKKAFGYIQDMRGKLSSKSIKLFHLTLPYIITKIT